eukprot:363330-Chlamydomonas_euryale.AAC.11
MRPLPESSSAALREDSRMSQWPSCNSFIDKYYIHTPDGCDQSCVGVVASARGHGWDSTPEKTFVLMSCCWKVASWHPPRRTPYDPTKNAIVQRRSADVGPFLDTAVHPCRPCTPWTGSPAFVSWPRVAGMDDDHCRGAHVSNPLV